MEPSLIKLWKVLFYHLVNVLKNNVMSAEQVGNVFGLLLIGQSSKHGKEVGNTSEILFVSQILNSTTGNSSLSDKVTVRLKSEIIAQLSRIYEIITEVIGK